MSANLALAWNTLPVSVEPTAKTVAAPALPVQPIVPKAPALRIMPLLRPSLSRRFVRVPTHAVGVHLERRECPRASLKLPLKLRSVAGALEQ